MSPNIFLSNSRHGPPGNLGTFDFAEDLGIAESAKSEKVRHGRLEGPEIQSLQGCTESDMFF